MIKVSRYVPGLDSNYFNGLFALVVDALCKIKHLSDDEIHLRSGYYNKKDYALELELLNVCCECILDGTMPQVLQILIEHRAMESLLNKEMTPSQMLGITILKSIPSLLQNYDAHGLYMLIGEFCSPEARFNLTKSLLFKNFN